MDLIRQWIIMRIKHYPVKILDQISANNSMQAIELLIHVLKRIPWFYLKIFRKAWFFYCFLSGCSSSFGSSSAITGYLYPASYDFLLENISRKDNFLFNVQNTRETFPHF